MKGKEGLSRGHFDGVCVENGHEKVWRLDCMSSEGNSEDAGLEEGV